MYISCAELEDLKRESVIELATIVEIPGTLSPKIKNFDLNSS